MTVFILALEPIETRYTGQWFTGFPECIRAHNPTIDVVNVAGEQVETAVTPGAFLNFSATNIWKNTQINQMALWFADGTVKTGDHVIFTDAWHTGIQQIKYMSELLDIKVTIHSMWHAGSYDPQDFLGRLIKDKRWTFAVEESFYHASDFNYFATEFHRDMFFQTIFRSKYTINKLTPGVEEKAIICGQPHNKLIEDLEPYRGLTKRRMILFPHRLAPEKQLEIFKDLEKNMPDVEFVVAQEQTLSKDQYHKLLGEAQVVFSANLQETLGIGCIEGVMVGTIPFVPDRLSYSEMYEAPFLYPSEWTENFDSYVQHRSEIISILNHMINYPSRYNLNLEKQLIRLHRDYLTCGPLLKNLEA
jgi:hypothetical protein